jgi:hypothetical protein
MKFFGIGSTQNNTFIIKSITISKQLRRIGLIQLISSFTPINIMLFLPINPIQFQINSSVIISNIYTFYPQYLSAVNSGQNAIFYNSTNNFYNITIYTKSNSILAIIFNIIFQTLTQTQENPIGGYNWTNAIYLGIPIAIGALFWYFERRLLLFGFALGFILLWLFFGYHWGWVLLAMFLIFLNIILLRRGEEF